MTELCQNRKDCFLLIRVYQVQEPVRSEWRIQDGDPFLSKNVPFWSVLAHIFETSGWNNIIFGSQAYIGIIHGFSDFDLGMTLCDLDLFLGRKTI